MRRTKRLLAVVALLSMTAVFGEFTFTRADQSFSFATVTPTLAKDYCMVCVGCGGSMACCIGTVRCDVVAGDPICDGEDWGCDR